MTQSRVSVPPEPTHDRGPLHDEQQVARMETLMLKGVRNSRQLGQILGITDASRLARYQKRVQARWEITGAASNLKRARGETLSRLDLIENELWVKASNTEDERAFIVVMDQLTKVTRFRAELLGLSAQTIEQINRISEDNEVLARMDKQERMVEAMKRFAEILVDNRRSELDQRGIARPQEDVTDVPVDGETP